MPALFTNMLIFCFVLIRGDELGEDEPFGHVFWALCEVLKYDEVMVRSNRIVPEKHWERNRRIEESK